MSYISCHVCVTLNRERPAELETFLCGRCFRSLEEILVDIKNLYTVISDAEFLVDTRDHAVERWMGGSAPCDTYVISLTDHRTKYTRKGDPVSARRILRAWTAAVCEARGEEDVSWGFEQDVQYLRNHLHWITCQPAVERFARHLGATRRAMQRVLPKEAAFSSSWPVGAAND